MSLLSSSLQLNTAGLSANDSFSTYNFGGMFPRNLYRLLAVVVHTGEANGGHFTTYRRGALRNSHRLIFNALLVIHWSFCGIYWFIDLLIHWSIDSLIHWSIDSLIHCYLQVVLHIGYCCKRGNHWWGAQCFGVYALLWSRHRTNSATDLNWADELKRAAQ